MQPITMEIKINEQVSSILEKIAQNQENMNKLLLENKQLLTQVIQTSLEIA